VKRIVATGIVAAGLISSALPDGRFQSDTPKPHSYLGFDRNEYPGDGNLRALHRSFAFMGYWLACASMPSLLMSRATVRKRDCAGQLQIRITACSRLQRESFNSTAELRCA